MDHPGKLPLMKMSCFYLELQAQTVSPCLLELIDLLSWFQECGSVHGAEALARERG